MLNLVPKPKLFQLHSAYFSFGEFCHFSFRQWFWTACYFVSQGTLEMSGDIVSCHNSGGRQCYWHVVAQVWVVVKHPTVHRAAPHKKRILTQIASSTDDEKSSFRVRVSAQCLYVPTVTEDNLLTSKLLTLITSTEFCLPHKVIYSWDLRIRM